MFPPVLPLLLSFPLPFWSPLPFGSVVPEPFPLFPPWFPPPLPLPSVVVAVAVFVTSFPAGSFATTVIVYVVFGVNPTAVKFPVLFSPRFLSFAPLFTLHLYVILFPEPDRASVPVAFIVKLFPPILLTAMLSIVGGVLSIFTVYAL